MEIWPLSANLTQICQVVQDRLPGTLRPAADAGENSNLEAVLGRSLLAAYAAGTVKVFRTPPKTVARATDFPMAGRLARYMAGIGGNVVNQWHENLGVLPPDEAFVLTQLDGTHSPDDLENALRAYRSTSPAVAGPDSAPQTAGQIVEKFATESRLLIS